MEDFNKICRNMYIPFYKAYLKMTKMNFMRLRQGIKMVKLFYKIDSFDFS